MAAGGVKVGIDGAVVIQPGKISVRVGSIVVKLAPEENLIAGLDCNGKHLRSFTSFGDAVARIKGFIQCAIRLQAGDVVTGDPVITGEFPANEDLIIRLKGNGIHRAIQAGTERGKGRVRIAGGLVGFRMQPALDGFEIGEWRRLAGGGRLLARVLRR